MKNQYWLLVVLNTIIGVKYLKLILVVVSCPTQIIYHYLPSHNYNSGNSNKKQANYVCAKTI